MPTTYNIPLDVLQHEGSDAVPWRAAREGDFILARSDHYHAPPCRAQSVSSYWRACEGHGPLYRIESTPAYTFDGKLTCYVTRQDLEPGKWMTRVAMNTMFSHEVWQVWRTDWSQS